MSKLVYICHKYTDNPTGNKKKIAAICREIIKHRPGVVPIAPQLFLDQYMFESTERDVAMKHCLKIMLACDEVWVYGKESSSGMRDEIAAAIRAKMKVVTS